MMKNLIEKNKGPLIAMGSAAAGLVVLIIISAIVNMPSDINIGQIVINLIWLIFAGLLLVAGVLYAREKFDGEFFLTEEDTLLEDEVLVERPLVTPSVPMVNNESADSFTIEKKSLRFASPWGIEALFGTDDFNQIEGSVKAIYTELEGLRAKGESEQATNPREKENQITKLTSDLEKAQAARDRWETKAISSTQEIAKLRQEIKEHGKWRPLNNEQLGEFFPTVTLRDGESEDAFLDSIRRQRRLMQRLNAEGYSIVCPVK